MRQNEEFFNEVLLEMTVPVEDFIRHHCSDRELAEDIMQEVFIEVHRNIEKLMRHENYKGWIMITARNKLKKALSKQLDYYARNVSFDDVEEGAFGQEPENEAGEIVAELFGRLTSEEAGLIRGFYLEGFSSGEMAKRLNITESALRMRLHRVKEKARKILKKDMGW